MGGIHLLLGIIAGGFAFVAYIPYIAGIFKGTTKPNRASYIIWSVVDVVLILSYLASGARSTVWTAIVYALFQMWVVVLSVKYGVGGFTKLDAACLLGAAFGIALWVTTKDPRMTLYISILCEALGYIPTIRKAYTHPHTESQLAWCLSLLAAICNVLAINAWQLHIAIYPLFSFIGIGIVACLLAYFPLRLQENTSD